MTNRYILWVKTLLDNTKYINQLLEENIKIMAAMDKLMKLVDDYSRLLGKYDDEVERMVARIKVLEEKLKE